MKIRTISPDELRAALAPMYVAFGEPVTDEAYEDEAALAEPHRYHVADEDGVIVGSAAAMSFRVAVPGGGTLDTGAITNVGVLPTHRRRGVASALMAAQLDGVADHGDAVATLWASESGIYRRFGYGPAVVERHVSIEPHRATFLPGAVPDVGGRMRLAAVGGDQDLQDLLVDVFERCFAADPGEHSRPAGWWANRFRDRERHRDGASPLFALVHESRAGQADGYALYRWKDQWTAALPANELRVIETVAIDDHVEAALWQQLLATDLVGTVTARRPIDDHLAWRLADWRRLTTTSAADTAWVRILDVPRALTARAYEVEGGLVLEVVDPFRPATAGRFALEVGPDGSSCTATTREPDLTIPVTDLGATYLGQHRVTTVAAAGRVVEHARNAAGRADRLLRWSRPGRCRTDF